MGRPIVPIPMNATRATLRDATAPLRTRTAVHPPTRIAYDDAMGTPVYTSNVRIERIRGPLRHAEIPAESEPVMFGVHAGIAEHYGVAPGTEAERATTLDYIVAAAGG